jgi:two-component system invasion response regulator UvrY
LIRILIADDHAIVRQGLKKILAEEFTNAKFTEAGTSLEVLQHVREQDWDVLVLDISMPGRSGLDILQEVRDLRPKLPVLFLSVHPQDQYAIRALRSGAAGYMTKDSAPLELVSAIRKVLGGARYINPSLAEQIALELSKDTKRPLHEDLSPREFEILRMIGSGMTVTQIANQLALSVKTVSTYRTRVLEKLGMRTTAELIQYAVKSQLVD